VQFYKFPLNFSLVEEDEEAEADLMHSEWKGECYAENGSETKEFNNSRGRRIDLSSEVSDERWKE